MKRERIMKKMVFALVVVVFVFSGECIRAQEVRKDLNRFEGVADAMCAKFGRGLVNVLTGLGEFPRQFARTPETEVGWVRWPVAFGKGALMSVVRTGVGAVETCLFFVPTDVEASRHGPTVYDYGPILYPSYVWTHDRPGDARPISRAVDSASAPCCPAAVPPVDVNQTPE
jgi:putative exosortase-associated protein (TIGR04073 family)